MEHKFLQYTVSDSEEGKIVRADDKSFHLAFRRADGLTLKWGRTPDDDPTHCPWGNEIADIEITTACRGIRGKDGKRSPCAFCYKSNQPNGKYMPFDTFKKVFDLMNQPKTMTQIAFGVDAECKTNPDVWRIMDYCLENNVVPNVTVADIDEETARSIVERCGACAVSCYQRDKNRCYDSIKLLVDEAKRQRRESFNVNMHLLVSAETADFCHEVIEDRMTDTRLTGMGAIVLLSLKRKGRGTSYHRIDFNVRKELVETMLERGIPFGMDSCGAPAFLEIIKDRKDYKKLESMVESCESELYSTYVNVDGKMFPCSFMEGEGEWKDGIDLVNGGFTDYTKEVWNHPRVMKWRYHAIKCIWCKGRNECPYYNI